MAINDCRSHTRHRTVAFTKSPTCRSLRHLDSSASAVPRVWTVLTIQSRGAISSGSQRREPASPSQTTQRHLRMRQRTP